MMKNHFMPDPEIVRRIRSYINSHEHEIIQDLKELVGIPSLRGKAEPGMPFGQACARAVDAAADLFERNGYSAHRREDRGYALASAGSGTKTIGVFCHCDVVRTDSGVWEQVEDPFCPEIKDGYLIGRGVRDNKGGVVSVLHALNAMRHAGIAVHNRIQVFLGGNEESGMQDILNFKKDHPMPAFSLVPDSSLPLCRGEASDASFVLTCDRPFARILDFFGGTSAGVCGEASVVLPNDPILREELTRALKGCTRASLTEDASGQLLLNAVGATAHPANPFQSINAGGIAAGLLLQCPSLGEQDLAVLEQVHAMLSEVTATYFDIANYDDVFKDLTLVIFQLSTRNGTLSMTGMTHFSPSLSADLLQKRMRNKCTRSGWSVTFKTVNPGFLMPLEHPAAKLMTEVYGNLCQDMGVSTPSVPFVLKAATYARHLDNAFGTGFELPSGTVPANFPAGHGLAHQPDECLNISNYKEGIVCMALFLSAIDQNLDKLCTSD